MPPATYATRLGQPPDDHFILGAFDSSGAMLGAVVCEREARLKKRHEAELVGMIIAPAMRQRGIGKALMVRLAKRCVDAGPSRFARRVLNWNEPSRVFYRAIGAVAQSEWTVKRVDGEALRKLAGAGG